MDFADPFGRTHLSPIRLPLTAIFTHPTSPPSTYPIPPNVKRWSEALCQGKGLDYASSTAARAGIGRRHPRTGFSNSHWSWRRYHIKGTMGAIDGGAVVGERGVEGGRGMGEERTTRLYDPRRVGLYQNAAVTPCHANPSR